MSGILRVMIVDQGDTLPLDLMAGADVVIARCQREAGYRVIQDLCGEVEDIVYSADRMLVFLQQRG